MNEHEFQGQWKQLKGKAQQKWGELTNDDLERIDGDRNILIGRIQERYGRAREQVETEVRDWLESLEDVANV